MVHVLGVEREDLGVGAGGVANDPIASGRDGRVVNHAVDCRAAARSIAGRGIALTEEGERMAVVGDSAEDDAGGSGSGAAGDGLDRSIAVEGSRTKRDGGRLQQSVGN